MQFVITAYDGEGMLDKRMEVRPLHLEGMERLKKHLIAAGGLLDDEAEHHHGNDYEPDIHFFKV